MYPRGIFFIVAKLEMKKYGIEKCENALRKILPCTVVLGILSTFCKKVGNFLKQQNDT